MKSILEFWPVKKFDPRPSQLQALLWLEKQTAKYILLNAPVGFGKSLVAITYSRWLNQGKGNSFILVPQKILQAQYEKEKLDDTNTLFSMYGKSNFKCPKFNTTCDVGSLLKKCKGSCAYSSAMNKSKNSNNTILNYTLGLLMFGFTQVYDKRELMICDEAHNLEEMLVNFNLLTISRQRTDSLKLKLSKFNNITDGFKWLNVVYLPKVTEELEILQDNVKSIQNKSADDLTSFELGQLKKYDRALSHVHSIQDFIEFYADSYQDHYVMISDNFKLEFKPVYGKANFNGMLKDQAERFLMMSGTILNPQQYCEDLGIPLDDVAFMSLDSEFKPDNRPVAYLPSMKMNASWNKPENTDNLKKYLTSIDTILNLHEDEAGIIHTGNFKIAEYLVDYLRNQKHFRIYHHNPESGNVRDEVIEQFQMDTKPRILISPSITEGLDLKYDKGRFNIIGKLPFPYLGDSWIKKRLDMSQEWYAVETAKDIMQACGRVVRSDTDYGTTYIIDGSWQYFYYKNSNLFPNWWKHGYTQL